jgi:6-pyruvoyltetrahydropterin/6-carboxytetrahydropterin synthase
MEFKVTFQGTLDDRNWVMDFGAFKRNGIKEHLSHMFDHTTVVASDDPELEHFKSLEKQGLIQLRIIEHVGCEKFAEYVYHAIQGRLKDTSASVLRVECFENGKNSAIFELSESNESSL